MVDMIARELQQDEQIRLIGFGTFEVRHRNARIGRNPQTKKNVEIPPANVPVYRPGKALKDSVNAD